MLRVCLCPSAACSVGAWSNHAVPQCPEPQIRRTMRIGPAYAAVVRLLVICSASALCSLLPAAPARAGADFEALTGEFVFSSLALSPVTATAQGYHRHHGGSFVGDRENFSPAGLDP